MSRKPLERPSELAGLCPWIAGTAWLIPHVRNRAHQQFEQYDVPTPLVIWKGRKARSWGYLFLSTPHSRVRASSGSTDSRKTAWRTWEELASGHWSSREIHTVGFTTARTVGACWCFGRLVDGYSCKNLSSPLEAWIQNSMHIMHIWLFWKTYLQTAVERMFSYLWLHSLAYTGKEGWNYTCSYLLPLDATSQLWNLQADQRQHKKHKYLQSGELPLLLTSPPLKKQLLPWRSN